MLRNKDINKISELKNDFTPTWVEPDFIKCSLKSFSFSSLCKCLSPIKMRGYSFDTVFSILLSLPFIGADTVNSLFSSFIQQQVKSGKDVFYRLKNNPLISWRLIHWLFANKFVKITSCKSDNCKKQGQYKCLVFDDTILVKTGKSIEKISRVWDHVTGRYALGFKLLLMGYWDGVSFIPADFSLHRERGKNKEKPFGLKKKELRKQYKKKRDKNSYSFERVKEVDESKIKIAVKMFTRAVSQGFDIDYVLMDSWFTCEAFIDAVRNIKKQTIHLIGMYKIAKTKFWYNNQKYTYGQIRNLLGKAKRCRKLGLYYKEATVLYNEKEIKLFFSKQGTNGKWKVFICTDTSLTFIKMIEIYQIRWTIEVFFKESKQLLNLGKCQSNDFDAQIADITVTMIQHIILTLRYRFDKYESKGALFKEITNEIEVLKLNQRLWGLFIAVLKIIETLFEDVDYDQLLEKIYHDKKAYQMIAYWLNFEEAA